MRTPLWMTQLIADVCEAEGIEEPLTVNTWRPSPANRPSSSGMYYPGERKLNVTLGTDLGDQRMVVLHELAHHVVNVKHGKGHHHSRTFWLTAWGLYKRHLSEQVWQHVLERESQYRDEALKVAVELGIPGAAEHARTPKAARTPGVTTWYSGGQVVTDPKQIALMKRPALAFRVGQRVECKDRRGTRYGVVSKINWTRIRVRMDDDGREWNWPTQLVKVIE